MKVREELFVLGIDMSRALDTIDRSVLLTELRIIINIDDNWRMIRALLIETELVAKLKKTHYKPFKTNIGAPQGDSLSPILFIIYLELAMRQIRTAVQRPPDDSKIPNEIIYADDTDFICTLNKIIESLKREAKPILANWNLAMNENKTKLTDLKENKRDQRRSGEIRRNSERC